MCKGAMWTRARAPLRITRVPTDFLSLFVTLNSSGSRYVVVGGLALVMHGIDRLTADVDLIVDLAPEASRAAVQALTTAGFRPLAPVDPLEFSNATVRRAWRTARHMEVFSFWDPDNRRPTVDLFLESPVPFDELWRDAALVELGDVSVRVASIAHLIRLKEIAGRPQDLQDIERLRTLPASSPP